jgi:hypothetical protein
MTSEKPICFNCKHIEFNLIKLKCKAFSNGIPEIILKNLNDHSKPLLEQENNIVFEPKNDIVDTFKF